MKKIFFTLIALTAITMLVSSCHPIRKTGCPGTEGIIH